MLWKGLSEADQEIIRLLFFENLSMSEAAQVLRVTDSSVSSRKLRALAHIRSIMRKQNEV